MKQRRERNYNGDAESRRLPPPPDASKHDALPSKLFASASMTSHLDSDKPPIEDSHGKTRKRKREGGDPADEPTIAQERVYAFLENGGGDDGKGKKKSKKRPVLKFNCGALKRVFLAIGCHMPEPLFTVVTISGSEFCLYHTIDGYFVSFHLKSVPDEDPTRRQCPIPMFLDVARIHDFVVSYGSDEDIVAFEVLKLQKTLQVSILKSGSEELRLQWDFPYEEYDDFDRLQLEEEEEEFHAVVKMPSEDLRSAIMEDEEEMITISVSAEEGIKFSGDRGGCLVHCKPREPSCIVTGKPVSVTYNFDVLYPLCLPAVEGDTVTMSLSPGSSFRLDFDFGIGFVRFDLVHGLE